MLTRISQGTIEADLAVIGSSRALVHYNCYLIEDSESSDSCINLGLNASGHMLQNPVLANYYDKNEAPKTLIINLDSASFSINKDTLAVHRPQQYAPYLEDPALYNGLVEVFPDARKYKYVPLYEYALHKDILEVAVTEFDVPKGSWLNDRDEKGYRAVDRAWDGKFDEFIAANPDGISYATEEDSITAVKEMIKLGQDSGSEVILVFAPEYAEFSKQLLNRDDILYKMSEIADEFDVEFFDLSNEPTLSFDQDNFYNSQHLKSFAADSFSRLVAERLDSRHVNVDK